MEISIWISIALYGCKKNRITSCHWALNPRGRRSWLTIWMLLSTLNRHSEYYYRIRQYISSLLHLSRTSVHYWLSQVMILIGTQGNYTSIQLSQATKTLESAHAAMTVLETNPILALPWVPDSPQHIEAKTLHGHQKYHQLLDEIKQCAVSCQFEIEKMGLSKTGEILLSDHPTSTSWSETDYKTCHWVTGCSMGENSPFHPWKAQHICSKHESTKAKADLDRCHKSGFYLWYCDTAWPWRYLW